MNLIFENSVAGRKCVQMPACDVAEYQLPASLTRQQAPHLPEMSETDISRHYTKLAERTYGVNNGFYPLGSCTMKYNPRINEEMASLPGFTGVHPLQPEHTVQGCLEVMALAEKYLCQITGMDEMTFQPAAGAHGELTGVLLIKQYHKMRGDTKRTKIIVPDSAHGTTPATAVMAGFTCVNVPSNAEGGIDLDKLREVVGEDTAGLMLTNPNTWVFSIKTFWRSPRSSRTPAAFASMPAPTSPPSWVRYAPAIWALMWCISTCTKPSPPPMAAADRAAAP